MSLLSPLALALLVVAAPIVLMYVLKLRRRDQPVSSTLLWRRALDDVQKTTDGYILKLDQLSRTKEKEILEIK